MTRRRTRTRRPRRQMAGLNAFPLLSRIRVSARPLATLGHDSRSSAWSRESYNDRSLGCRRHRLRSRFILDNTNQSRGGAGRLDFCIRHQHVLGDRLTGKDGVTHGEGLESRGLDWNLRSWRYVACGLEPPRRREEPTDLHRRRRSSRHHRPSGHCWKKTSWWGKVFERKCKRGLEKLRECGENEEERSLLIGNQELK